MHKSRSCIVYCPHLVTWLYRRADVCFMTDFVEWHFLLWTEWCFCVIHIHIAWSSDAHGCSGMCTCYTRRIYNCFEVGNLCMYVNLWGIYALLCFLSVSGRSQYQWRDVPHLLLILPSKQCHTLWKQSFWYITFRRSQVSVFVWNSKMPIYCTL